MKWMRLMSIPLIVALALTSCSDNSAGSTNPLSQNIEILENRNGEIVSAEEIKVRSAWSRDIDTYRIRYLSDGLEVVGFVVKPEKKGTYPAVIFNRGGNREYGKITEPLLSYFHYFTACGYVVLGSQYRGNDGGEGTEQFGGDDVNDVINLISTARSLPFVDPENIVMLGFSRGGMMTYLAIRSGADIRAAAVVGGVADVEQLYTEREQAMKNVIETLVGTDREEWRKRSAVNWPDEIDIPLLILHGSEDDRVNPDQALRLANLLRDAGKTCEFKIVEGGDHGLKNEMHIRNTSIVNWFDSHLE